MTASEDAGMALALGRVVLYARDVEATVAFYATHFGFSVLRLPGDRIVELERFPISLHRSRRRRSSWRTRLE